jgi:hypothetical protein
MPAGGKCICFPLSYPPCPHSSYQLPFIEPVPGREMAPGEWPGRLPQGRAARQGTAIQRPGRWPASPSLRPGRGRFIVAAGRTVPGRCTPPTDRTVSTLVPGCKRQTLKSGSVRAQGGPHQCRFSGQAVPVDAWSDGGDGLDELAITSFPLAEFVYANPAAYYPRESLGTRSTRALRWTNDPPG